MKRKTKDYDNLCQNIIQKNKKEIIEYRKQNLKKLKTNYIIFYIFYTIFTVFCIYYVTVFCAVYQGSSLNWLSDGFIGILIFFTFKTITIFVVMLIRVIFRANPNKFTRILNWIGDKLA
jgi:hypothetical protein